MSIHNATTADRWSRISFRPSWSPCKQRILDQPTDVRSELEPLLEDVLEHTVFRNRVMLIARDALERFRLDMAALQFELDATKRERERDCL